MTEVLNQLNDIVSSKKSKIKGVNPKFLRRQKDIREFYQYIHANNLRQEALYRIDSFLNKAKIN